MAFMQRQVTEKQKWYQVETSRGTEIVPFDLLGNYPDIHDITAYCEGNPITWEVIEGYGARLSAPGYMDRTEWSVHDTEQEAEDYLEEMYPEDEEDGEDTDQTE